MTAELIAGSYRMAKLMLHRMIDDLNELDFAHQPCAGANSATWIVGHLAITLQRTAKRLGVSPLPELPAEWAGVFAQTKQSAGDQSQLGNASDVVKRFDELLEIVMTAVCTVPEEALIGPSPMPGGLAANYGEALAFGAMHIAMHCGQLSTIRRSLGKPPLV